MYIVKTMKLVCTFTTNAIVIVAYIYAIKNR